VLLRVLLLRLVRAAYWLDGLGSLTSTAARTADFPRTLRYDTSLGRHCGGELSILQAAATIFHLCADDIMFVFFRQGWSIALAPIVIITSVIWLPLVSCGV
jgi:hypothetical protein